MIVPHLMLVTPLASPQIPAMLYFDYLGSSGELVRRAKTVNAAEFNETSLRRSGWELNRSLWCSLTTPARLAPIRCWRSSDPMCRFERVVFSDFGILQLQARQNGEFARLGRTEPDRSIGHRVTPSERCHVRAAPQPTNRAWVPRT